MKKNLLSLLFIISISFVLSGLQVSLYFLPLPLPQFWIILLTYYSFNKSLPFILVANLVHLYALAAFSSMHMGVPLVSANIISISFYLYAQRFNSTWTHLTVATGLGTLGYYILDWLLNGFLFHFAYPDLVRWITTSLATFVFAPAILPILASFEQRLYTDRVDTLENLRI